MKKVEKNKKPFIKTRTKANGGVEVEITKSPSNTITGKVFAAVIAFLTLFGGLGGLIYLFIQLYK